MYYGYQEQTYGWGSSSYPRKAVEQVDLVGHLQSVPERGVVVDVGAFIGVTRPDVQVVSVDPGYNGRFSEQFSPDQLDDMIDTFEPCQRLWLRNCDRCRKQMVAADAENLPLADGSADLVVSYAVTLEHSWDTAAILAESLRVLKVGAITVYGPIAEYYSEHRDQALDTPEVCAQLTERTDTHNVISPWGEEYHVLFSALRKR